MILPAVEVDTRYRRIRPPLPSPEAMALLEASAACEPVAVQGQPPVVWDRAEGFQVFDAAGNRWIDFTSGVLVTNAGHAHPRIVEAILNETQRSLLHTFGFANEPRIRLARRIAELLPEPLSKVFLLTTGSEAVECAIKQMRTHGLGISPEKQVIVSFANAFHGRTLGSQMIGGIPAAKAWIGRHDPYMIQVPFPDGYYCPDQSFDLFEQRLNEAGFKPAQVAGVIAESYQGGGASFGPPTYFQKLRAWCDTWNALLTFDEVQASFGRTGRLFAFEHYEVVPDLITLGKGVSGALPLSALAGRADLMDQHGPLSMTNTHGGNPVCCAAALANINAIIDEGLVEKSARLGEVMHRELWQRLKPYDTHVGAIHGLGLLAGVHVTEGKSDTPDGDLARRIVEHAVGRGIMLFAPVGVGGATIKLCPPLCIPEDALVEGIATLAEAFAAVMYEMI